MVIRFKKLHKNAVAPTKAHSSDAGFDLVATSMTYDNDGNEVYGTGVAVEIPEGYVGLLFPRSSISRNAQYLTNSVGVIDAGYRGEIMCKFKSTVIVPEGFMAWLTSIMPRKFRRKYWSSKKHVLTVTHHHSAETMYEVGDRIAQLIIMPYPAVELEEADELSDSERGEGGYGSTGK